MYIVNSHIVNSSLDFLLSSRLGIRQSDWHLFWISWKLFNFNISKTMLRIYPLTNPSQLSMLLNNLLLPHSHIICISISYWLYFVKYLSNLFLSLIFYHNHPKSKVPSAFTGILQQPPYSLSPSTLDAALPSQPIFHTVARMIFSKGKSDHVTYLKTSMVFHCS